MNWSDFQEKKEAEKDPSGFILKYSNEIKKLNGKLQNYLNTMGPMFERRITKGKEDPEFETKMENYRNKALVPKMTSQLE